MIVAPPHEAHPARRARGLRRRARRPVVRDARRAATWSRPGPRRRTRRTRWSKDGYRFVFHTPKYRHGAHTMPIDTDMIAVLFGPFGDLYRHDKRMPVRRRGLRRHQSRRTPRSWASRTATTCGSTPTPRTGRSAAGRRTSEDYEFARLLCRARYYPGTPRGVTRMWFNMYGATPGSRRGAARRAPTAWPRTRAPNYQAMFRSGSHQSATRGWLKPTWMTDSLVRKDLFGQAIGKGFLPDVHCPTGAPRESIVKITRAEPGGIGRQGPVAPGGAGHPAAATRARR